MRRSPTTGSCRPTRATTPRRSRRRSSHSARASQPAIVQVNEIATATMMAAKGAIYPVFELMRDQSESFSPEAYLPAVTGYYSDVAGNMLSFPFNVSTPILYYNKDAVPRARASIRRWRRRPGPRLAPAASACARPVSPAGSPHRGPPGSMSRIFPRSTICRWRPGPTASAVSMRSSTFNNPLVVRHIAQLAEWQSTKVFDYSGRGQSAEPRFQKGECGIFIGSSGDARGHQGQFEVRGRLRHDPVLARNCRRTAETPSSAAPRCGCCATGRAPNTPASPGSSPYLSKPEVQAGLAPEHRLSADHPRRLRPHPRAGLLRPQSRHGDLGSSRLTLKPPTENSKGIRLGSFVLIRDVIDEELEQCFQRQAVRAGGPRSSPSSAATACCASSSGRIRTDRAGQMTAGAIMIACLPAVTDGETFPPFAPIRRNGCRSRAISPAATAWHARRRTFSPPAPMSWWRSTKS